MASLSAQVADATKYLSLLRQLDPGLGQINRRSGNHHPLVATILPLAARTIFGRRTAADLTEGRSLRLK